MATIRAYTTIEQSRKLAEILPLESADMGWNVFVDDTTRILPINDWDLVKDGSGNVKFHYAWSLAALLNVLPDKLQIVLAINDFQGDGKKKYAIGSVEHDKYDCYADNPIDACIAMIEKLHELKML